MASPDVFSFPAGTRVAYGGRGAPVPAWLVGRALNEWHVITGTLGSNSNANLEEFSGFALVGTKLVAAASGGHHVSDNRVVGIDLGVDVPAWPTSPLNPPSPSGTLVPDGAYNTDGKPGSRHSRYNIQHMPGVNGGRVMLLGARDLYTLVSPGSKPSVDGFNLTTNTWDAAGTYPDCGTSGQPFVDGGACVDPNGDGWIYSCTRKFDKTTFAWSTPLTATAANRVRYPWCLAAARNMMFGLCYGDGWTSSTGLAINAIRQVGNVQTQITFNASAAVTQFLADTPIEAGMDYDQTNDYFLFCSGSPAGRVYKIIPNNTSVWDMQIFSYGASNVMPGISVGGTQSRFKYVAAFKGFVLLPGVASNLIFLRTA